MINFVVLCFFITAVYSEPNNCPCYDKNANIETADYERLAEIFYPGLTTNITENLIEWNIDSETYVYVPCVYMLNQNPEYPLDNTPFCIFSHNKTSVLSPPPPPPSAKIEPSNCPCTYVIQSGQNLFQQIPTLYPIANTSWVLQDIYTFEVFVWNNNITIYTGTELYIPCNSMLSSTTISQIQNPPVCSL